MAMLDRHFIATDVWERLPRIAREGVTVNVDTSGVLLDELAWSTLGVLLERAQSGCQIFRPCCCSRADDGHCWGCGLPESVHTPQYASSRGERTP